jgi:Fur family ferric uptake transcriptional regulator
MTVSPDPPRLRFQSLEEVVSAMRDRGLRLSTARRLILEALFSAEGPVSAVHLARTLSIDESSVYRNLEVLETNGVVRHVHLGHGAGLYVLLGGEETEYLYCGRCAKVTVVAASRLTRVREEIERAVGYQTRFTHFAIVGVCESCQAEPAETPGQGPALAAQTHSHGDFVHSHSREDAATLDHQH